MSLCAPNPANIVWRSGSGRRERIAAGARKARSLRGVIAALFAFGYVSVPSSVSAQSTLPGSVSMPWVISDVQIPTSTIRAPKGKSVPIAKARPQKLIKLETTVTRGSLKSTIPQGTVFGNIRYYDNVICEPARREKQSTIACLGDVDGDGKFDHFSSVDTFRYQYGSSTRFGFLTGSFETEGWTPMEPASVSELSEVPVAVGMQLTLTLRSPAGGLLGGGTIFDFCAERVEGKNIWGGAMVGRYCTSDVRFPLDSDGLTLDIIGKGRLTLESVDKSHADVSVSGLNVGDSVF